MPKILIINNIIFYIFGIDINENRRHIHVFLQSVNGFKPAKIWIEPEIEIAKQGDFKAKEINNVLKLAKSNIDIINSQLDKFFKNEPIKIIKK